MVYLGKCTDGTSNGCEMEMGTGLPISTSGPYRHLQSRLGTVAWPAPESLCSSLTSTTSSSHPLTGEVPEHSSHLADLAGRGSVGASSLPMNPRQKVLAKQCYVRQHYVRQAVVEQPDCSPWADHMVCQGGEVLGSSMTSWTRGPQSPLGAHPIEHTA